MARAAPRGHCDPQGGLSRCVDAALLLSGAEKAEPVAGRWCRTGVTRGCVWGRAAGWVLMLWGRGVWMAAAPSAHWGPLGILGSTGLPSPGVLPLRGKNSQTPFSTTQICSYAGILGRICSSLSFVLWVVFGVEGGGGQGSPTCGGCQMCWLVSGCRRLRRDAAEDGEQMAGR